MGRVKGRKGPLAGRERGGWGPLANEGRGKKSKEVGLLLQCEQEGGGTRRRGRGAQERERRGNSTSSNIQICGHACLEPQAGQKECSHTATCRAHSKSAQSSMHMV